MHHLRDLEEYTADMAEAAAREAAEIRALLENQQRIEIARQRHGELVAHVRQQLFKFAKVVMAEAAQRLSGQMVAKIRRRAMLEILVPLAIRYQSWTKV